MNTAADLSDRIDVHYDDRPTRIELRQSLPRDRIGFRIAKFRRDHSTVADVEVHVRRDQIRRFNTYRAATESLPSAAASRVHPAKLQNVVGLERSYRPRIARIYLFRQLE